MKLAIVDSWFSWPPYGGAISSIKQIADGLAERGTEISFVVPKFQKRGEIAMGSDFGFAVHELHFPFFDGPSLCAKVRSALDEIRPDVVMVANGNLLKPYMMMGARKYPTAVRLYAYELICHASYGVHFQHGEVCPYNFIKNPSKCLACTEDKKRPILRVSAVDRPDFLRSYSFFYPLFHRLVKSSISSANKFIVTSNYMKGVFSDAIGAEKLSVIPEGVDGSRFSPREVARKKTAEKVILIPGRVYDGIKGAWVFMAAASQLWNQRTDFRAVLTGSGNPDLAQYPFVQRDRWVPEDSVPDLYRESDIVVVPSIWEEPFGLTALEAMSCGVPVIASRIGGLPEMVKDGETGLLFQPGDVKDLARKMTLLLDDETLRTKLGRNARAYVQQNYRWPPILDSYMRLFESLHDGSRTDPN